MEKCTPDGQKLSISLWCCLSWRTARALGQNAQMQELGLDCEVRTLEQAFEFGATAPGSLYLHLLFAKARWAHPLVWLERRLPETWCHYCKGETHAESCNTKQYLGADSWSCQSRDRIHGYSQAVTQESLGHGVRGRKQKSPVLFKYTDSITFIRTWTRGFSILTVTIFHLIKHVTHTPFLLKKQKGLRQQWEGKVPQVYILLFSKISDNLIRSVILSECLKILSKFQRQERWLNG